MRRCPTPPPPAADARPARRLWRRQPFVNRCGPKLAPCALGRLTGAAKVAESILRRKIGRGRAATAPSGPELPERMLQLALGRAAQDDCGLPLIVVRIEAASASLAEVLDRLEPATLLLVLEGAGEALGLVALGHPVLSAVIEQQTAGRLSDPEPPPRRPTRIDAALCAPMIDRVMAEFEDGLGDMPGTGWAAGYRYSSFIEDPRPLGLVLEDCRYRLFQVHVALGPVARPGRIVLALPDRPAPPSSVRPSSGGGAQPAASGGTGMVVEGAAAPGGDWHRRLRDAVLTAPASIEAVLTRLRLPLAQLSGWGPGTLVPLPLARLDGLSLEAPRGKVLGTARLGQARGLRALRLSSVPGAEPREDVEGTALARPALPAAGPVRAAG